MGEFETKIVTTSVFFFAILGLLLSIMIPQSSLEELSIGDFLTNFNPIAETSIGQIPLLGDVIQILFNLVFGIIFFIVELFFTLFGISFISNIAIMPLWFNTLLFVYVMVVFYSLVMLLIGKLWIGGS